ncbi:MAG: biopolymer transporter ExbD [bacterium]|nr:biopolymer transporter ExbD [bacterium]
MKLRAKKRKRVLINITSLIDVLFLLLIFFMVSSTFVEKPGMDLELPESETSTMKEIKDLVLQITPDGKVTLNSEEITMEVIEEKLREEHELNTAAALILKADKEVKHGVIVRVMDAAKLAGIPRIIIATTEKVK